MKGDTECWFRQWVNEWARHSANIHPNEIEMGFKYRIMYFIHVGLYIYEKIHLYEAPNQTRTKQEGVK